MPFELLQTKLTLPLLRPAILHRPNLYQKLNRALDGTLIVVAAPAGYGKSTLVADWITNYLPADLQQKRNRCAWLSLDVFDDDPNRFWQYVIGALKTSTIDIADESQYLSQTTPLPQPPALLTPLINSLAGLDESIIMVLDDYHVISNIAIHAGIEYLVEHAPHQLHCIILTRADPPLSLARLRAQGLLHEIRAADLQFNNEETAELLIDLMELPLTSNNIATLRERTEGWITGLMLAAVSLRNQADPDHYIEKFSGSHYYIMEYLAEEVLALQQTSVRTFLLQTSILQRLCGPLCDAVTSREDSHLLLEQLNRQKVFLTPLDDEHEWYRFHPLLGDLLSNLLAQNAGKEDIRSLHRRASGWYEEDGNWELAVLHAIEAEDWEGAARVIALAYTPLFSRGWITTWQYWLQKLPSDLVETRPELLIRRGWAEFLNGQIGMSNATLKAAEKKLDELPDAQEKRALHGELSTYLATIAFFDEDADVIIQAAEKALVNLPADDLVSRARATNALGLGFGLAGESRQALAMYKKAVALARRSDHIFLLAHALETVADGQMQMGRLNAAIDTCHEIIVLGTKGQGVDLPFAGNGHIKLASIYTSQRQLERAREHLDRGLVLIHKGGIGYTLFEAYCVQSHLRRALGDNAGSTTALKQAEDIFWENRSSIMAVRLAAAQVLQALAVGDVDEAAAWAELRPVNRYSVLLDELPIVAQEVLVTLQASVRLAQGQPVPALDLCDQIHDTAKTSGRMALVIEISLVRALALQAIGEIAAAVEALRGIISLTRAEGYVQPFIDAGLAMGSLLGRLPEDEIDDYVSGLIGAYPVPVPTGLSAASASLVDPLTPRELEILRLIAAGLANKQIASELMVSLNTVKKHSSHIYGKLGVTGRTQAIARAHELDLL